MNQQIAELDQLIVTEEERSFYQVIDDFTTYYFTEVIPPIMNEYEIKQDPSVDLTDSHVTLKVKEFLNQTKFFQYASS